jgi:hypothetical protein
LVIQIDPVLVRRIVILGGGGIVATLALVLLWPRRRGSLSAEELRRFGVVCRGETDQGTQTVTHLETPPVGPRVTVRTIPGAHRTRIKMG